MEERYSGPSNDGEVLRLRAKIKEMHDRIYVPLGITNDGLTFEGVTYARRRLALQAAARKKGTHTPTEWVALRDAIGRCVSCGITYDRLNGGAPTKDHIVPLIAGGCDCIANIQPACRNCNSGGIGADLRRDGHHEWLNRYFELLGGPNVEWPRAPA